MKLGLEIINCTVLVEGIEIDHMCSAIKTYKKFRPRPIQDFLALILSMRVTEWGQSPVWFVFVH